MDSRNKIAVVAGKLEGLGALNIFEALVGTYPVSVCAIQDEALLSHFRTGLELKLFRDIADMPGYMRGAEEAVQGNDLVIGLETSRLATFQAVRAAMKMARPVVVIVNETRPFLYEGYNNIRAIQADIYQNASKFVATSAGARDRLMIEGIKADRIVIVPPAIGPQFRVVPEQRAKFRKYVGIGAHERLIIFHEPLEAVQRPMELIMMLKGLLAADRKTAELTRLMFVGTGALERDLKYRAYDLGLGANVMFLHQDPSAFLPDLYNAADIMVTLRKTNSEVVPPYPRHIIEAMGCGVVPVVPAGGAEEGLAAGAGIALVDDGFHQLAREIGRLVADERELASRRTDAAATAAREYGLDANGAKLKAVVTALLVAHQNAAQNVPNASDVVATIEQRVRDGALDDAMVMIEDQLLRGPSTAVFKSELLRMKGDICVVQRQLDVATEVYGESVQTDDGNHRGYFGLGQVAFLSHSNEDAMIFFKKALGKCPNHGNSMMGIGLIHQRIGLVDEAMFWLNKCLVSDHGNQRALTALTQACLESRNPPVGIVILEQLRDSMGEVPGVLIALGQLYMREGRVAEGRAIMAKVLTS